MYLLSSLANLLSNKPVVFYLKQNNLEVVIIIVIIIIIITIIIIRLVPYGSSSSLVNGS